MVIDFVEMSNALVKESFIVCAARSRSDFVKIVKLILGGVSSSVRVKKAQLVLLNVIFLRFIQRPLMVVRVG